MTGRYGARCELPPGEVVLSGGHGVRAVGRPVPSLLLLKPQAWGQSSWAEKAAILGDVPWAGGPAWPPPAQPSPSTEGAGRSLSWDLLPGHVQQGSRPLGLPATGPLELQDQTPPAVQPSEGEGGGDTRLALGAALSWPGSAHPSS